MAADWITRGVAELGTVDVVGALGEGTGSAPTRDALGRVRALLGRDDPATALGAGTRVSGRYYLGSPDTLLLQAELLDVRTGAVLRTVGPVSVPRTRPLDGANAMRTLVAGALGSLLDPQFRPFALATRQPPTYEAYREFMLGVEAPDWPATLAHHLAAARLDTSFDYTLVRAARAYLSMGECHGVDSVAGALAPRRARMTPFEIASLDVSVAVCANDPVANVSAAERVAALAPKSDFAQFQLAEAQLRGRRFSDALAGLRRIDPERGWFASPDGGARSGYFSAYTETLLSLGRFRELLELANHWPIRRRYDQDGADIARLLALGELHRCADADTAATGALARIAAVRDDYLFAQTAHGELLPAEYVLASNGCADVARRMAERLLAASAGRQQLSDMVVPALFATASRLYRLGRWPEAAVVLDSLLAGNMRTLDRGLVAAMRASALASGGSPALARRMLDSLVTSRAAVHADLRSVVSAVLRTGLGDRAGAIADLAAVHGTVIVFGLGVDEGLTRRELGAPVFDALRGDSAFARIVARAPLP